ncbi:MAG: hypothetical protein LBU18_00080 [Treponema sp.]|jgi:hypothetical protein|nr:hypothetical protein [Treponema sp.]
MKLKNKNKSFQAVYSPGALSLSLCLALARAAKAARAVFTARAVKTAGFACVCCCAAALAACSYPSAPDAEDELSLAVQASGKINKDGTVSVIVPVPQKSAEAQVRLAAAASRSLVGSNVKYTADTYEVVFYNKTLTETDTQKKAYYLGTGKSENKYINIAVYPGETYNVLFLAGKDGVLLAAGYEPSVKIEAGKSNLVPVDVKVISPQWLGDLTATNLNAIDISTSSTEPLKSLNDFAFGVDGTNAEVKVFADRYVQITPKTSGVKISSSPFAIGFNIAKLQPLLAAETGKLTFYSATATLAAVAGEGQKAAFPEVKLKATTGSGIAGLAAGLTVPTSGSKTYTLAVNTNGYIVFASNLADIKLPDTDAEGLLHFNLEYYAFGTADSGGSLWTIMNGLKRSADDGQNEGGYFRVLLGNPVIVPQGSAQVQAPGPVADAL